MHHLECGKLQARLKQLVNRAQSSPDIQPVALKETPLHMPFDDILAAAPVQLSPQRLQSIGVKLGRVQRKAVSTEVSTAGNVALDETRLSYVQVRFPGFIEKVFVDATYQSVHQGQPLFTVYSPDIVATEREYLVAKRNQTEVAHSTIPGVASGAASLLEAAVERLKEWQVPQTEIDRLQSNGTSRPGNRNRLAGLRLHHRAQSLPEYSRAAGHAALRHYRPFDCLGQCAGLSE